MRADESDNEQRTLWCGNLPEQVADEILYELFLQAGPVESIRRPRDPSGRPKSFAFILYKHECSVPYALELFRGEKFYNRALNLSTRSRLHHIPVLDTHKSEFTECLENKSQNRKESRGFKTGKRHLDMERDSDESPKSWAEYNTLKGKGSLISGHLTPKRMDFIGANHKEELRLSEGPSGMPDFNALFQMSQQMMVPGMLPQMSNLAMPLPSLMGSFSPYGNNPAMYPSMQGEMSGGKRYSPERDRRRNNLREEREPRRDHPYRDRQNSNQHNDRRHSDNHYDHRRHDRGYASSRSSHERERRDRRSR